MRTRVRCLTSFSHWIHWLETLNESLVHYKLNLYYFMHNIKYISLYSFYNSFFILDNPFQCDCRIAWLRDWINNKGSAVISMPQETKCVSPEEYKDILLSEIPTDQLICLNSATKNTHNLGVSVWKSIFSVLLLMCVL